MGKDEVKQIKCYIPECTVSPATGGALVRLNEKGIPAIWACDEHMKHSKHRFFYNKPNDAVIEEINSKIVRGYN